MLGTRCCRELAWLLPILYRCSRRPKGDGMNGAKGPTNGAQTATNGTTLSGDSLRRIMAARERFAAGADSVRGVRPEILMSWYRCREEYEVDPGLQRAPAAAEVSRHSIEHDVVRSEERRVGKECRSRGSGDH